jgi:WD40 repeat protein
VAAGSTQRTVSSGDVGRDSSVQVWDVSSGERRFILSGHEAGVWALSFTDDRRWIVTASYDGTIRYWNRNDGQLTATVAIGSSGRWAIVTDKGVFAASSNAGELLSVVREF